MLREENDYLKAEIVGLKRELTELSAKIQEEQAEMQRRFEEERAEFLKKFQDEREAMQKKLQEATKKKNGAVRNEPKAPGTTRKEMREGAVKAFQPSRE
jgi:predicted Holliday junction resolvase-like endonuclease